MATSSASRQRDLPLFTREQIAQRIIQGAILIIYHSKLINATSWTTSHPGGSLALLHFVGRDASDEIDAYHSEEALKLVAKYAVGRVQIDEEEGWIPLTPPLALGLVKHPDGVKGHWAREGIVSLGQSILQRGVSLDSKAAVPSASIASGGVTTCAEVILLTADQLEPEQCTVDRRKERMRSKAYQELRIRIREAGLFNPPGPLAGYGSDIIRYTLLGGGAFSLFFLSV
jgi:delta8-fatty-acid desaturase